MNILLTALGVAIYLFCIGDGEPDCWGDEW